MTQGRQLLARSRGIMLNSTKVQGRHVVILVSHPDSHVVGPFRVAPRGQGFNKHELYGPRKKIASSYDLLIAGWKVTCKSLSPAISLIWSFIPRRSRHETCHARCAQHRRFALVPK